MQGNSAANIASFADYFNRLSRHKRGEAPQEPLVAFFTDILSKDLAAEDLKGLMLIMRDIRPPGTSEILTTQRIARLQIARERLSYASCMHIRSLIDARIAETEAKAG